MVALVQVEDDRLFLEALVEEPLEEGVHLLLRGDGEDLHVLVLELVALVRVRRAVPGGQEGVHARRLFHGVAHGDVLHHLALPALHRGAHDYPAVIPVLEKGEDLGADEVREVGALRLKDGYGPGLGGRCAGHGGVKRKVSQAFVWGTRFVTALPFNFFTEIEPKKCVFRFDSL